MYDKMYGSGFINNRFFKGMNTSSRLDILQKRHTIHLNKGEYVYYSDQIANNGIDWWLLVYIILSGRVNAVIGRGMTVKSFVQGSYFGDFEMFSNERRIFSTRAEEDCTLVYFEKDYLVSKFGAHPQSYLAFFKRTLQRYYRYKMSKMKADPFAKLSIGELFWEERLNSKDALLNRDVRKWFEELVHYHERGEVK